MGWKYFQTVDPPKESTSLVGGLFSIRLLILHFKFQFSKPIKSSTFHIFLNLSLSQNAQKSPKIYTKPQNIVLCSKERDLALLETCMRYWHKGHVEQRHNSLLVKSRLKGELIGKQYQHIRLK